MRQLAADLCLSLRRNADAVKLLGDLFERQVGVGDATRASLTYKKLARHGSPTWQQKFRFGQLLEGSNKKLAVGTYEAALLDLGKLGKKKEVGRDFGSHCRRWSRRRPTCNAWRNWLQNWEIEKRRR